tara:strand:- start:2688 stop:3830 length:1143 start_codon:yes stop_codon:yes gene_type:complete
MSAKNNDVYSMLEKLVSCKSITPYDDGCQSIISDFLKKFGFEINIIEKSGVSNLIATYGNKSPRLAFVGHTDVVPIGQIDKWNSPPFELHEDDGTLFGRGTSDMKGSIASMLIAIEELLKATKDINGSLMVILTSDEEGPAIHGIQSLVKEELKDIEIDFCLVGEPSCKENLGDTIKNGRRGSLSGSLEIRGVQGHIAYPQNARNPIHLLSPVLEKLINQEYDNGNEYFPATSFQVSNINSGAGASNIIPGILTMDFNFRYSTETDADSLKKSVISILDSEGVDYSVKWSHSGEPYLSRNSRLLDVCSKAVQKITNNNATISTDGGTSDGRFMAKICDDVIEFGLVNKSIHKINESTTLNNIVMLKDIYCQVLQDILTSK